MPINTDHCWQIGTDLRNSVLDLAFLLKARRRKGVAIRGVLREPRLWRSRLARTVPHEAHEHLHMDDIRWGQRMLIQRCCIKAYRDRSHAAHDCLESQQLWFAVPGNTFREIIPAVRDYMAREAVRVALHRIVGLPVRPLRAGPVNLDCGPMQCAIKAWQHPLATRAAAMRRELVKGEELVPHLVSALGPLGAPLRPRGFQKKA